MGLGHVNVRMLHAQPTPHGAGVVILTVCPDVWVIRGLLLFGLRPDGGLLAALLSEAPFITGASWTGCRNQEEGMYRR